MKYIESLTKALTTLQEKGYTNALVLEQEPPAIYCPSTQQIFHPSNLAIDEIYHIAKSDVCEEETVVYAISSQNDTFKGVLLVPPSAVGVVDSLCLHNKIAHQPIRRAKALVGFSREHHHALLLCWKIKMGLAKNISIHRIDAYLQWFYQNHLLPHFEMEEKYLFPILPEANLNRQTAIAQHRQLTDLITQQDKEVATLVAIQNALNEHIRFEERVLFNEIQNDPNFQHAKLMQEEHHETKFVDNETDAFWASRHV